VDVVMRAMVLVALAACRVADLDYEGKQCPCPDGWQCNLATDTCTQSPLGDGGNPGSDSGDGELSSESCLASPRSFEVYASPSFADFATDWFPGNGNWARQQTEVLQSNGVAVLAWLMHIAPSNNGSYGLVATMRLTDANLGGSVGIGFRISNTGNMYTCDFDPKSGELEISLTQALTHMTLTARTVVVLDPRAAVTMEIDTAGADQTCCLRGYDDALVSVSNSLLTGGNVGIVTRETKGGFTSFFMYE
jgi:hypothetical protein